MLWCPPGEPAHMEDRGGVVFGVVVSASIPRRSPPRRGFYCPPPGRAGSCGRGRHAPPAARHHEFMETLPSPYRGESRTTYCEREYQYQSGPPVRVPGRTCLDCRTRLRSYDPGRVRCDPCHNRRLDWEHEVVRLWLETRSILERVEDPTGKITRTCYEAFVGSALDYLPDPGEIIEVLGVHREARSIRRAARRLETPPQRAAR